MKLNKNQAFWTWSLTLRDTLAWFVDGAGVEHRQKNLPQFLQLLRLALGISNLLIINVEKKIIKI